MTPSLPQLVEHLFRHEAGKLVSGLTRRLGATHWDLAEEAVQEALVRALRVWPFQGLPPHPAGWLATTAHNVALDRLRHDANFARLQPELARRRDFPTTDAEAIDDQLAMMFACCHPSLSTDSQVALVLKTVCGFSVAEIARGFLAAEASVAQRIVRSKRTLAAERTPIAVPPPTEMPARLDAVLAALYLLFNEGYSASQGDDLIRHDLCAEAIRLGRWLARHPDTTAPRVHALVALMLLQASRLPARVDEAGNLLLLAEQDRSRWDERLVHAGLRHIDAASEGDEMSNYHIEAGIAAVHAVARDDAHTDWPHLLRLYDLLAERTGSPVVEMNRAIVLSRVEGEAAGLAALDLLARRLHDYSLYHATRADLLKRLHRFDEAAAAYRIALGLPCNNPERRFLTQRLASCEAGPAAD